MDREFVVARNLLAQTIALLLSLAFMAERAAFSPARKRRELIDIIRAAEGAGLRLAASYGDWQEGTEIPDIGDGYSRDDALRLAVSLRAVAMVLWFQLQRFDAYRANVRDCIAAELQRAVAPALKAKDQNTTKVPPIDTAPDPPCAAGKIKHAIFADLPLPYFTGRG